MVMLCCPQVEAGCFRDSVKAVVAAKPIRSTVSSIAANRPVRSVVFGAGRAVRNSVQTVFGVRRFR